MLHKLQHSNCPPRNSGTAQSTTDRKVHHGQHRAPRTEQSTTDRTEHHGQNRIGQNRTQSHAQIDHTDRTESDRTESDRTTESTEQSTITRTECTTAHTHMITRRVPQEEALIMYEEGTCTNAMSSSTKRGRARTPCRRRSGTGEEPKEGDGSKRIVASQRHLLSIRQ